MTGLAFLGLWLGGFALAVLVIPGATAFIRAPQERGRVARAIIRRSFRLYVGTLRHLGVISLTIQGSERLAETRGLLVIANHPSLLDVVLIVALLPDARCVIKHEIWQSFLLGPLMRLAGYIPNGGDPDVLMRRCREALREGGNLIVFPEGTRSVPGEKPRFHRGFAHIATIAESDLQPIVISCNPPVLLKGQAWYEIPPRRPHFQVDVQPIISTANFLSVQARPRAARAIVAELESFYHRKVLHG